MMGTIWQRGLLYPDAGVEEAVEDVGEDVDEHQQKADEKDGAHDDGEVILLQAVDNNDAHALPIEDIFDEDGTRQQTGQPAGGRGDHRVQRVAQSMVNDHAATAQPLGAGGADIILAEGLKHGVLGELRQRRQRAYAQREGRQDEVLEVDVFPFAIVVDGVEVAKHIEARPIGQHVCEEPGDEDGGEERRQRHAEGGEHQRGAVDPGVLVQGADDAEGDAHRQGEQHGHQGQEGRLREGGGDNLAHLALALIAAPQVGRLGHQRGGAHAQQGGIGCVFLVGEEEIARRVAVVVQRQGHEVVEVVEVLQADGLVAPQVAVDDGYALGVGALAQHHAGGVARQDVEEEEHQRHHSQQHQEPIKQPFSNKAQHIISVRGRHFSWRQNP